MAMELILGFVPGFVLTFARVTAMFVAMTIFGNGGDARWPRLVLAVGISAVLFLRAPAVIAVDGWVPLAVLATREVFLGLVIGFAIQIVFMVLRTAGAVLGHEMGFSMAQVVDPNTGQQSPVMGRLFEMLGFLFFLAVDGHHEVFRVLSATFDKIPVGRSIRLRGVYDGLVALVAEGLELAISLATPVYAVLLLLTVVLVVIARAVPQIHLMEFGYAVRIMLALGAAMLFMTTAAPHIYHMFRHMFTGIRNLAELV